jgi:hypothetical protein
VFFLVEPFENVTASTFSIMITSSKLGESITDIIIIQEPYLEPVKHLLGYHLGDYGYRLSKNLIAYHFQTYFSKIGRTVENPVFITTSTELFYNTLFNLHIIELILHFENCNRSFDFVEIEKFNNALKFLKSQPELNIGDDDQLYLDNVLLLAELTIEKLLERNANEKLSIKKKDPLFSMLLIYLLSTL